MRSRLRYKDNHSNVQKRFNILIGALIFVGFIFILRLAFFQIFKHDVYQFLASNQHDLQEKLMPKRGKIFLEDKLDSKLYPLATNRDAWDLYVEPKNITDPQKVVDEIADLISMDHDKLKNILTKDKNDPYELLARDVDLDIVNEIKKKNLQGVKFSRYNARLYPEKNMSGQVIGVVTEDKDLPHHWIGRYGIEANFEKELAGIGGYLEFEKDAKGRRIIFAKEKIRDPIDGSDIVLTLNRAIQYQVCSEIKKSVIEYQADSGTIIVLNSNTGAILAMCSYPNFEPSNLKEVSNISIFNNPATFTAYEPGSVMKAITLAAGLNENKITPKSTYNDEGFVKIDKYKIRNADRKAHGIKTMTEVLEMSLNTGSIFVQRLIGRKTFARYITDFGFGQKSGIELSPESIGNVKSLQKIGDIFVATASYGQGITATPIQLIKAYNVLAHKGELLRPYIVSKIIKSNGDIITTEPKVIKKIISEKTARVISRMLVSVVEEGHGGKAKIPGYWVAGKTGTAQVAKRNGRGYDKDKVITTFIGYAPADNPRFVVLVKFNNPQTNKWAGSTAAPTFAKVMKYLLQYFNVQPNRK